MSRSTWITGPALWALAVLLASPSAEAQTKPFKISGAGVAPQGIPLPGGGAGPHWIVGNATHLGRHDGAGAVQTDSATFLPDGRITGEFGSAIPFVFVGANGDRLACHYGRTDFGASDPGTFELTPVPERGPGFFRALWIAEFVPVPGLCTGKFQGVSGSWIMIATSEPFLLGSTDPVVYEWEGDGSLTFRRGR